MPQNTRPYFSRLRILEDKTGIKVIIIVKKQ